LLKTLVEQKLVILTNIFNQIIFLTNEPMFFSLLFWTNNLKPNNVLRQERS